MLAIAIIVGVPGVASAQSAGSSRSPLELVITIAALVLAPVAIFWFWKKDVIRPGSFKRRPGAEAPPATLALVCFAIMLGCMVVASLASIVASGAFGIDPKAGMSVRQMGLVTLVVGPASVLAAVGAIALAHRLSPIPRFRLSLRGFGLGFLLAVAALPLTAAASALTLWIAAMLGHAPADAIAHDTLDAILDPDAGVWRWVLIAGAVLVTPIVEESLFRGLLQSAFAAVLPWRWGAVLAATALFTLAHTAGGVEWHSLPAIAVLGLSMGIAYERTGRLAVPIAMHLAFNGANVVLAMML